MEDSDEKKWFLAQLDWHTLYNSDDDPEIKLLDWLNEHNLKPEDTKITLNMDVTVRIAHQISVYYYAEKELPPLT